MPMDEDVEEIRERLKEEMLEAAHAPDAPLTVTGSDLGDFVQRHDLAVLDVWAEWCGPCKRLEPIIEDLADELSGRVVFGKLDADANPDVVERFGIQGIPTLLVFKEGEPVDRITGVLPKDQLKQRVLRHAG